MKVFEDCVLFLCECVFFCFFFFRLTYEAVIVLVWVWLLVLVFLKFSMGVTEEAGFERWTDRMKGRERVNDGGLGFTLAF